MATQLIDQPTATPTNKVAAAGIAGALSVFVIYLVGAIFGIEVPAEVASAFTTLVAFVAAYFKRNEAI